MPGICINIWGLIFGPYCWCNPLNFLSVYLLSHLVCAWPIIFYFWCTPCSSLWSSSHLAINTSASISSPMPLLFPAADLYKHWSTLLPIIQTFSQSTLQTSWVLLQLLCLIYVHSITHICAYGHIDIVAVWYNSWNNQLRSKLKKEKKYICLGQSMWVIFMTNCSHQNY